jgi:hypothetical protein
MSIIAMKFSNQDIGVLYIMLGRGIMFTDWHYREFTTVCFIQQRTKNKAAVKSWEAKPFHPSVDIDIADERAIANDAHLIDMTMVFHYFLVIGSYLN